MAVRCGVVALVCVANDVMGVSQLPGLAEIGARQPMGSRGCKSTDSASTDARSRRYTQDGIQNTMPRQNYKHAVIIVIQSRPW